VSKILKLVPMPPLLPEPTSVRRAGNYYFKERIDPAHHPRRMPPDDRYLKERREVCREKRGRGLVGLHVSDKTAQGFLGQDELYLTETCFFQMVRHMRGTMSQSFVVLTTEKGIIVNSQNDLNAIHQSCSNWITLCALDEDLFLLTGFLEIYDVHVIDPGLAEDKPVCNSDTHPRYKHNVHIETTKRPTPQVNVKFIFSSKRHNNENNNSQWRSMWDSRISSVGGEEPPTFQVMVTILRFWWSVEPRREGASCARHKRSTRPRNFSRRAESAKLITYNNTITSYWKREILGERKIEWRESEQRRKSSGKPFSAVWWMSESLSVCRRGFVPLCLFRSCLEFAISHPMCNQ